MDCIDIDVDNGESGFFIIEIIDAREREIIFLSSVFTRPKTFSHKMQSNLDNQTQRQTSYPTLSYQGLCYYYYQFVEFKPHDLINEGEKVSQFYLSYATDRGGSTGVANFYLK